MLATATSHYTIGFDDLAGPLLAGWTGGATEDWSPEPRNSFETSTDRVPAEFSALGTRQVRGAELIVDHGGGLVGARLCWRREDVEFEVGQQSSRFRASATDTTGELRVVITIETSREHDVVAKHAVIENLGAGVLELTRVFAPCWQLPVGPGASVAVLSGDWSREFTPSEVVLPVGELSIGSRQGITSHTFSPVVRVASTGEPDGAGYGIALAWSGSWRLSVDAVPFRDRIRVAAGVDDESCVITLEPGESFATPDTLGVFAPDGAAGVRRRWHDYQRAVLSRDLGVEHRPIVYNSWYATTFDVRIEHQLALADRAAELGVEAFVVDDGWFVGRTSDRAGLGDWRPDPVKFPDGLRPLADGLARRGLRFGLWVEPEAVNPDSELYRAHPDWVYRPGDRPLVGHRNQYVLDLGRPEVLDWVIGWLRTLLSDGAISYLKWDMNRPISDGGRPGDRHGRQWTVQHTRGYYAVLEMIRAEFPSVTLESCAGGGGRIDLAVLARTDVVWPSDETGARDRLAIQHGFLSAYGPHLMSSWVTDRPSPLDRDPVSFEFRFLVAMAGVLGIGSDLMAWSEAELAGGAELIALYREVRETVHRGRVELHHTPRDPWCAVEYGTAERSVVLVWARPDRPAEVRISARTLDPGCRYRMRPSGRPAVELRAPEEVVVTFALAADAELLIFDRTDERGR